MNGPLLSVVIPTRNEAGTLPGLLRDLARQQGPEFEVVVADGASEDGTPEAPGRLTLPFPWQVVRSAPGRGRQMNVGTRAARGPDLLFLHADTRLPDPELLARATRHMAGERERLGHDRVAGHFGLRFRRSGPGRDAAFYFYEAKTRTNRPGTVHGDQGIWISRSFLGSLGGFDETLPFLEDADLAARVFRTGVWTLLPGTVLTSARRFEAEGLGPRQALNALILAAHDLGWHEFLAEAPALYREQTRADRLDLVPFLRLLQTHGSQDGFLGLLRRWMETGGFVARNAWQLAFAWDCRRNRRRGIPPGDGPTPWTDRYDRWGSRWVESGPGAVGAAVLTAAVFYGLWAAGALRRAMGKK
ncbi:MAG: glycosyltransferase [Deltaproteobacteria bacterium]|nr:glycosyltransferase [Deltaproteobacteria bacterium]